MNGRKMVQRTKERLARHCGVVFKFWHVARRWWIRVFWLNLSDPENIGYRSQLTAFLERKCEKINFSSFDYEIISSTNCLWLRISVGMMERTTKSRKLLSLECWIGNWVTLIFNYLVIWFFITEWASLLYQYQAT